ncbi:MAG TPA: OB-fold domain-containing protein [Sphingopyxis sp.]|nr:OB-fold domain-containing protein [Sphingopyxis sp.]
MSEILFDPPRDAPWIAPYWAGVDAGEWRMPHCANCGRWIWYPQAGAATCCGAPLTWHPLSGRGQLFTWTRVHHSFLPDAKAPYLTGLIVPDEAPYVRIAARLVCEGNPTIGGPVQLAFDDGAGGRVPYFIVE